MKTARECLRVYVGEMPVDGPLPNLLLTPERELEMARVSSPKRRREMAYAWLLLEKALAIDGLNPRMAGVIPLPNGGYRLADGYLSWSHDRNLVALALSSFPVGIDIVDEKDPRFASDRFLSFIAAEDEIDSGLGAARLFAMKEALFKKMNGKAFVPKEINVMPSISKFVFLEEDRRLIVLSSGICKNKIGTMDFKKIDLVS